MDDRLPLYQRIRDDLLRRIKQGEWKPNHPLPSELALAKGYSVAPGTMRQAIQELVNDGTLERSRGRGTFVRQPKFIHSMFRFFRLQGPEGQPIDPKGITIAREICRLPKDIAHHLGVRAGTRGIRLKRLRLADGQPLLAEDIWLPLDLFQPLKTLPLEEFGDLIYPLYERLCGVVIASTNDDLTVQPVRDWAAELLSVPAGTAAISIERTAFDYEGRPIEWRFSQGRADRFHYNVRLY